MALLLFLLALLPQEKKGPEELQILGRWKAGKLETRVGDGPWVTRSDDLLEQLRAAGAAPETRLVISLPSDAPEAPVSELLNLLKAKKYARIEFPGVVVVEPPKGRKPAVPRKPATPLKIEIVHEAGDCAAHDKDRVCTDARHWSIRVDQAACRGRDKLLKELRREASKEVDPQFPAFATRPATVWAEAKAPYGLVLEVGVACESAGFFRTAYDGTFDAGARAPRPAAKPVLGTDEEKSPAKVQVGARWKDGAVEFKVDRGPWFRTEQEWMDQVRAKRATSQTLVLLDPAADLPWSAVLKMRDLLQDWGFVDFSYIAPCFPLDGPVGTSPVSEQEALDFARAIDQGYRTAEASVLDRVVYREELFRRTLGTTGLSVGMRVSVERMTDLSTLSDGPIKEAAGQSPALRFLSMQKVDGEPRPLFRLLLTTRLDYVQYVLAKTPDGALRIVDAYLMSTGECLSETLRAQVLGNPAFIDTLNTMRIPTPADMALCMGKAGRILELFMYEKPQDALDYYEKNAAEFKGIKVAHRARIGIAGKVSVDEFCRALEEFERDLPRDPAHTLLRVERHLLRQDREKGLAAIDALDKAVTGDPYLHVLRAKVHLAGDDLAKARASAEKATVDEPALDPGWWMTISVCLAQKDFAATARFLTAAGKALKIQVEDPAEIPLYAEFVKSPEYVEWMKSRK